MQKNFHSFVIFAEMRTGSNFLESNLNALGDLTCLGEAFNPHFIGYPKNRMLLGYNQRQRDARPDDLLNAMADAPEITGFRYFHDHDPRILDRIINDRGCAKIILSRDSVDSYVSWKIAQATGQWKLTDVTSRKEAKVAFDPVEYASYLAAIRGFRQSVTRRIQATGQTAFSMTYPDLQSLDVINGLARYLGSDAQLEQLDQSLKVQNPVSIAARLSNIEALEAKVAQHSARDFELAPELEPHRFAVTPTYVLGAETPVIFMPLRGGPEAVVAAWMAAIDGVSVADLTTGLSQKELRQWKRARPGHRSFTVVRHPVARAHHAFCRHILGMGKPDYTAIRRTLVKRYKIPIPLEPVDSGLSLNAHRNGFKAFLRFLQANLNGQTSIRIDPVWCGQAQVVAGFGNMALPDQILREDELDADLPALAKHFGRIALEPGQSAMDRPFQLSHVYDDEIEDLTAAAYLRDYTIFGFDRWRA